LARVKKDPEERKAEIFEAARRLFVEKGFDATTVSDIVKDVGVSQGAFYWYFDSKEDILVAIADEYATRYYEELEAIFTSKRLDAAKKLERLFRTMEKAAGEGGKLADELHTAKHRQFHHWIARHLASRQLELVKSLVQEGLEEGLFDTPDPEAAALFLMLPGLFSHIEEDVPFLAEISQKRWLKHIARWLIASWATKALTDRCHSLQGFGGW